MRRKQQLSEAMTRWLEGRYQRREISRNTYLTYRATVRQFTAFCGAEPVRGVDKEMIDDWSAALRHPRTGGRLEASSTNAKVAVLRSFFGAMALDGTVDRDPTLGVGSAIVTKRPPRWVPPEQVARVLAAAPPRSRTMVVLGVQLGLRVSEIAGLRVEDWDRPRGFLRVAGKGAKERNLPVTDEAAEALGAWLSDGRASGPMWPTTNRRRAGQGLGITVASAGRAVAAVVRQLDLGGRQKITTHAFRHTAATDALREGASLADVVAMLGHAGYGTVGAYLSVQPEDLRAAIGGRRYATGGGSAAPAATAVRQRRGARRRRRRAR